MPIRLIPSKPITSYKVVDRPTTDSRFLQGKKYKSENSNNCICSFVRDNYFGIFWDVGSTSFEYELR